MRYRTTQICEPMIDCAMQLVEYLFGTPCYASTVVAFVCRLHLTNKYDGVLITLYLTARHTGHVSIRQVQLEVRIAYCMMISYTRQASKHDAIEALYT